MSFLKKLLEPKPGGSFVGNLLRGAGINRTAVPASASGEVGPSSVNMPYFGTQKKNVNNFQNSPGSQEMMKWGGIAIGILILLKVLRVI